MKKQFLTFLVLWLFLLPAAFAGLNFSELRAGDVLLLSLNCYECRMIESETESLFSHSGVVVSDSSGELKVAQSLGKVALYSFEEFTKNKTPGTFVHVYRAHELSRLSGLKKTEFDQSLLDLFNEKFKGAPFDSKYIWNNFNTEGVELLYCSEFIAKLLDSFLRQKTILHPISYSKHYDYWYKYFKGNVPEGEPGNSPAAFSRDSRFFFVGKF